MTVRDKGLSDQQTLVWNAENWLSEVQDNNGNMVERHWYDVDGSRVKKTSGNTTASRYYKINGLRIAVKRGGAHDYWHGDQSNFPIDPAATRET